MIEEWKKKDTSVIRAIFVKVEFSINVAHIYIFFIDFATQIVYSTTTFVFLYIYVTIQSIQ